MQNPTWVVSVSASLLRSKYDLSSASFLWLSVLICLYPLMYKLLLVVLELFVSISQGVDEWHEIANNSILYWKFSVNMLPAKMGTRPSKSENRIACDDGDLNGFYFGSQFLAEELVSHILSLGDVETIKICRLVCKRWCLLISNRYFWKMKVLAESKHWPNIPLTESMPCTFYISIYQHQPFERNLIKNPCGKGFTPWWKFFSSSFLIYLPILDSFQHWDILSNGGDEFAIEQPPSGSDKIPHEANMENDMDDSCFVSSYHSCSKEQIINLRQLGLTQEVMDEYKPCITFTDWY